MSYLGASNAMPMRLKDNSGSHFGKRPLEEPHGQTQGYTAEYNIPGKGILDVTATSAIIEQDFAVCQLCHHLNPDYVQCNQVANQVWIPWAMREFKDATAIRSCSFDIAKGVDLVESANEGCDYCGVLCGALATMLPDDWEAKESHLTIHLAWGLPIIINFKYGALWKGETLPKDLDPFRIFAQGIEPVNDSGNHFTIQFTPDDAGKEHILELYKPHEVTASQAKGFPELRYLGNVPERFKDLDCAHSYSEMKRSIEQCRSGIGAHTTCRVSPGATLPSRILYIGTLDKPTVRLLKTIAGIPAQYNALSYRWGGQEFLKTVKASVAKFRREIAWETLPPLFQDAITLSRNLRVQYLWIDSLCIVQDDKQEWAEQAPKMGTIYTNAYVTITCASASSPSARILGPRPPEWQSKTFGITDNSGVPILLRVRQKVTSMVTADRDINPDHLANRAWIWQERLLSSRNLVFTNAAMKFECRTASVWEDQQHPGHSFSSLINKDPQIHWTNLIEDFTRRDITFSTDRIYAIQSVMNTVQEKYKLTPLCGLWRETLTKSLHWGAKERLNGLKPHASYLAPTWSWASLEGAVEWSIGLADGLPEDDKQWDLKLEGVEFPDPAHPEAYPVRETLLLEGRFMRASILKQAGEYFVVFAGGHVSEAIQFIPDTELVPDEPVPGKEGYHYSTRRKKLGENVKEGGWVGQCACMLIVRTGESGASLVLAPSLDSPEATYLERLGVLFHHPVAEILKQPRRVMKVQ